MNKWESGVRVALVVVGIMSPLSLFASGKSKPAHHVAKRPTAHMRAQCYEMDSDSQGEGKITGVNNDEQMEIGSVSKIFTSYWAVAQMGAKARFTTNVYIQQVDATTADVFLQGSRDPFFGRQSFQAIVAQLNMRGIKKIRELSFDGNFKYYDSPESATVAHGFYLDSQPTNATVANQLWFSIHHLNSGYTSLLKYAKKQLGLNLPAKLSLQVKDLVPVASVNPQAMANSHVIHFKSAPLYTILKEMNRLSNNYAADQIFDSLGNSDGFTRAMQKLTGLKESDVVLYNGSGDRYEEAETPSQYNAATCNSILKVLHALKQRLAKENLSLTDVMYVVGEDSSSTVQIYNNRVTEGAVVAKTGTVDPTIALAGMASTKKGQVLFASIFGPGFTGHQRTESRAGIDQQLVKIISSNGGAKPLNYDDTAFTQVGEMSSSNLQK